MVVQTSITVEENNFSIFVKGENGNSLSYQTQDIEGFVNGLRTDLPVGRMTFDAIGSAFNYTEYSYNKHYNKMGRIKSLRGFKPAARQRFAYKATKALKARGLKLKPSTFRTKTVPRALKIGGRVLGVTSFLLLVKYVSKDKSFKISHSLDTGALLVCFAGPYGWIVGLGYFAVNTGILLSTGNTIGDYANDWADENGLDNGTILNLDSFFNWINGIYEDIQDN